MATTPEFLKVTGLSVGFRNAEGEVNNVIANLNLMVHQRELVAIIGASGSGKSLMAESLVGLYAANAVVEGEIAFKGQPVGATELARLRGSHIGLVPQSVTNLDPLMKVGNIITGPRPTAERIATMDRLLQEYGLDLDVKEKYPFELSGGMARRVVLVSALVDEPEVLIADEPTPGMHEHLANQAMGDFRGYAESGHAVVVITHDVDLAIRHADRIVVFYEGDTVEEAPAETFQNWRDLGHPFSQALVRALPTQEFSAERTLL